MSSKFKTFISLLGFLNKRKKQWLIPIIIVLVILAAIVVFGENSVVAPFIYSLF